MCLPANAETDAMIIARGLTKRFGKITAVHSVDFDVPQGAVVALLGPNGAGKSTTIRMMTGFLTPSSGSIALDGLEVATHRSAVQQQLGYLPESNPLYTEMRVHEFLGYRARLFGVPRKRRQQAIDSALQRCWLADVRRRPIHQLSKGYRQRVGLAAALLHDPKVLILDEPTSGLDPSQIHESRQLIRDLAGKHTIILSTHILSEAEQSCDRAIVIMAGRIRAQGTLDELHRSLSAQRSPFVIEARGAVVESAVRAVKGVASADVSSLKDNWVRLRVLPSEHAGDLRESIASALRHAGAEVRELRRESPSLEQLFMQLAGEVEQEHAKERGHDSARRTAGYEKESDTKRQGVKR